MGRDGSHRITILARTFTAKYRDGQGIVREISTGCRDETAARSILADLERRAELVKANVMTSAEDRIADHQAIPLTEHFDAYTKHQTAKDLNETRIKNTKSRLYRIATDQRLSRLSDVTAEPLERWLVSRAAEGMSAGARNGYREAWVGFGNWCVSTNRLISNPISDVPKADAKADCRRKRRALTEDELNQLLAAARRRPLLNAMTIRSGPNKGKAIARVKEERRRILERLGHERALIYKAYLLTGLRKAELASLTVGQLELDTPTPYATLEVADEKNREGSDIALRSDLVEDIRDWLSDKLKAIQDDAAKRGEPIPARLPADTRLFKVPKGLLRILDRDLEFAGIPKVDERGRTVDIHALRHTFGTHLSKGGVAPRTAQAAMRHSDIDMTMNVYTDPKLLDVHGALDALPAMSLKPDDGQERMVAGMETGNRKFAPGFAPKTDNQGNLESIPDTMDVRSDDSPNARNPEKHAVFRGFDQSGRLDLNQRPLRPERSALPG